MDICGPFPKPSWNGQQYFISFRDDGSRYGYLYLICEKSKALDMFKIFKAKVENQFKKKKLRMFDLIVVVNTTTYIMASTSTIQVHLLNS